MILVSNSLIIIVVASEWPLLINENLSVVILFSLSQIGTNCSLIVFLSKVVVSETFSTGWGWGFAALSLNGGCFGIFSFTSTILIFLLPPVGCSGIFSFTSTTFIFLLPPVGCSGIFSFTSTTFIFLLSPVGCWGIFSLTVSTL